MPSDCENLSATISLLISQQLDMMANPKPSYSVGGLSVSWGELYSSLQDRLDKLLVTRQRVCGPTEIVTRARG